MTLTSILVLIFVLFASFFLISRIRPEGSEAKKEEVVVEGEGETKPNRHHRIRRGHVQPPHQSALQPSLGSNPLAQEKVPYSRHLIRSNNEDKIIHDKIVEPARIPLTAAAKSAPIAAAVTTVASAETTTVMTVNVVASKEAPYTGYELLQALLSSGLRYGKMNIFHRHEEKTGHGRVLFSLASMVKPGTFDLPTMGGFSCQGLSLFFVLEHSADPRKAYEVMLETASQLVEDLGGEVLDKNRKPMSREWVAEQREMIRDYAQQQQ